MNKTQKALKLALEALEECRRDPRLKYEHPNYDNIITALRRALAVSETHKQPAYRAVKTVHEGKAYYVSEPEQPAQQQEPVAYMNPDDLEKMKKFGRGSVAWATPTDFCTQPVYTSPPASKPWVGLTTNELDEIDAPIRERGHATIAEIYRAIEAKLREKNTGEKK